MKKIIYASIGLTLAVCFAQQDSLVGGESTSLSGPETTAPAPPPAAIEDEDSALITAPVTGEQAVVKTPGPPSPAEVTEPAPPESAAEPVMEAVTPAPSSQEPAAAVAVESPVTAEVSEEAYFNYMKMLNDEKKKAGGGLLGILSSTEDILGFKLKEYADYHRHYFPSFNSDVVQFYIIHTFIAQEAWAEFQCAVLKFVYVYPQSPLQVSVLETGSKRFREEKYFKDNRDKLLGELNVAATDPEVAGRYFAYLETLFRIRDEALTPIYIREARSFLERFPNSKDAGTVLSRLAAIHSKQELHHRAYLESQKILTLYPQSTQVAPALYKSGVIQADKFNEYEPAVTTFRAFLSQFPQDSLAHKVQYKVAWITDTQMRDWVTAVQEYQILAQVYPDSKQAIPGLMRVGEIQAGELNRITEAVQTYRSIVQKYPDDPLAVQAQLRSAAVFEQNKKYPEAVDEYLTLFYKFSAAPEALEALEKCVEIYDKRLKDQAKTMEILQMIADNYPDTKNGKNAQKRLSKMK